jgi:hypothetical protein
MKLTGTEMTYACVAGCIHKTRRETTKKLHRKVVRSTGRAHNNRNEGRVMGTSKDIRVAAKAANKSIFRVAQSHALSLSFFAQHTREERARRKNSSNNSQRTHTKQVGQQKKKQKQTRASRKKAPKAPKLRSSFAPFSLFFSSLPGEL